MAMYPLGRSDGVAEWRILFFAWDRVAVLCFCRRRHHRRRRLARRARCSRHKNLQWGQICNFSKMLIFAIISKTSAKHAEQDVLGDGICRGGKSAIFLEHATFLILFE